MKEINKLSDIILSNDPPNNINAWDRVTIAGEKEAHIFIVTGISGDATATVVSDATFEHNVNLSDLTKVKRYAKLLRVTRGKHAGQFRFLLIADNGEPVSQSHPETYKAKQKALETLHTYFSDFRVVDKTK